MPERRAAWLLAAACSLATPAWAQSSTRVSFELPRAATTSAGVYDLQGRLVRTLWRGDALPQGRHERRWDGLDDLGRPARDEPHEVRLVHHQIRYVWEGVIGNTSRGTIHQRHRAYLPPQSLVVVGDQAYYAVGYNEQQPGIHGFALAAPQLDTRPLAAKDTFAQIAMLASDGHRLYWANTGGLSRTSFVGVYDLSPLRPAAFTRGQPVCLFYRYNKPPCEPDQDYKSVIDVETQDGHAASGLAVQREGRVLAVAHPSRSRVRLFDKTSGAALGHIEAALKPLMLNQIAFTPAGDLWVISGRQVLRYTDVERSPRLVATISGLARPVAVATAPDSEQLWVADGGESQQLKQFDPEGRPGLVLGRRGGYASDPQVEPDKLCFRSQDHAQELTEQTGMAQTADGKLWVIDTCNNRMLRFPLTGATVGRSDEQIAYLPGFYLAAVDHANPRRVFANFLEFEAPVGSPWQPTGTAWRLVRNWLGGLPAALTDKHAFNARYGGLSTVETLSNGRTYGMVRAFGGQYTVVELPASGPLRVVRPLGAPLPGASHPVMYENGDLGHALTTDKTQTVLRRPLTGFDADGNPTWAPEPVVIASVPTLAGTPYSRHSTMGLPPRYPITGGGLVVYLDPSVKGNEGFHLGAARLHGTEWLWQASPTGPMDGKGSYQTQAVRGWLQYGGNAVLAHGRHIVYGYHGEFFPDPQTQAVGQANQFMHFDESGLFLGQFGSPSTRPMPPDLAGVSGNAFTPSLVRTGNQLFLYHNEEATHGGLHRWRIDGWNDVQDLRGQGQPGTTIQLR